MRIWPLSCADVVWAPCAAALALHQARRPPPVPRRKPVAYGPFDKIIRQGPPTALQTPAHVDTHMAKGCDVEAAKICRTADSCSECELEQYTTFPSLPCTSGWQACSNKARRACDELEAADVPPCRALHAGTCSGSPHTAGAAAQAGSCWGAAGCAAGCASTGSACICCASTASTSGCGSLPASGGSIRSQLTLLPCSHSKAVPARALQVVPWQHQPGQPTNSSSVKANTKFMRMQTSTAHCRQARQPAPVALAAAVPAAPRMLVQPAAVAGAAAPWPPAHACRHVTQPHGMLRGCAARPVRASCLLCNDAANALAHGNAGCCKRRRLCLSR